MKQREFWINEHNFIIYYKVPLDLTCTHVRTVDPAYDKAVEAMVEALKIISKDFGTDYCDGNCVEAYEALAQFRDATREEKG